MLYNYLILQLKFKNYIKKNISWTVENTRDLVVNKSDMYSALIEHAVKREYRQLKANATLQSFREKNGT